MQTSAMGSLQPGASRRMHNQLYHQLDFSAGHVGLSRCTGLCCPYHLTKHHPAVHLNPCNLPVACTMQFQLIVLQCHGAQLHMHTHAMEWCLLRA